MIERRKVERGLAILPWRIEGAAACNVEKGNIDKA
jgi:hypothetical protein